MNTPIRKGTFLVTGASSGIGAVYAERLARRGHDLVLVARDAARLGVLAAKLTAETGRDVGVLIADLTFKADVHRVEDRLYNDAKITGLVNNAGVGGSAKLIDSDPDELEALIDINVVALTRLASAAARGFVERGGGTIVNIASIVALAPELLSGAYSGSKAYVVNFSQSMHGELADKGVRVQAVLPGVTVTDFWDKTGVPVAHLPKEWAMCAGEMVDAALAGLDQGEVITIPSLPDIADWNAYEAARKALGPGLSRQHAAERYRLGEQQAA
ncbi:SDR family oxidoreductase [Rudaea sp.]|uniref:SDR family NAD(P)-dependent oxidoreductase n=1 Tax=Rudaea sp. TaxID=2136325 RepID=UPI002ED52A16